MAKPLWKTEILRYEAALDAHNNFEAMANHLKILYITLPKKQNPKCQSLNINYKNKNENFKKQKELKRKVTITKEANRN